MDIPDVYLLKKNPALSYGAFRLPREGPELRNQRTQCVCQQINARRYRQLKHQKTMLGKIGLKGGFLPPKGQAATMCDWLRKAC